MASNDALDLSQIDPPVWRIKVADAVYGPYTLGQMRGFIEEGRVNAASRVTQGVDGEFLSARDKSELSPFFPNEPEATSPEIRAKAANFVVTAQTDGDGRRAVISAFNQIGRFSELMPGTFILNAEISAFDLRNQLSTILAERGKFVIVNADTGQLAWMGLGADIDQHARAIWKRKT